VAVVVEDESHEGIFGLARVVYNGGGGKLRKKETAVGRPAERIDDVAEELGAAIELLTFKEAAALAVRFLEPDIVVVEVVEFGFEATMNRIGDAAVGGEGEGGDVLFDGLERLVEILGAGRGREKEKRINTRDKEKEAQSPQRRMQGEKGLDGSVWHSPIV
jgi:hypothetical protein